MSSTNEKDLVAKPFSSYIPIIISVMLVALLPGGFAGTASLMLPLLAGDYQVNVSAVSVYMSIGGILMALMGPFMGKIFFSFDVKIGGIVLLFIQTASYVLLATNFAVPEIIVVAAIQYAFGLLLVTLYVPTVVNRWFKDRSGTVLGLSAAMTGIGGAIFIMVAQVVIDSFGYRSVYWMFAALTLVCVPFILVVAGGKPSDRGMLPYVSAVSGEAAADVKAVAEGKNWSVNPKVATKSVAFWTLVIMIVFCQATVMVAQFFPAYVNSIAATGGTAFITGALLATLVMIGQAVFKVVLGMTSDAASPARTIFIAAGAGIVALLCIWFGASTFALPVGGLIFGMFYACPAVLMPLVAGYAFGTGPNFSVIWGRTMLPSGLLTAPAPTLWPLIAENFGGYGATFACAICCVIVFTLFGFLTMRASKNLPHETIEVGTDTIEEAVQHAEQNDESLKTTSA